MSNYYIKFGLSKKFDASSKAMKDIMYLLRTQGYKEMPGLPVTAPKWLKLLDIPIMGLSALFGLRRKGILFYVVPSNYSRIKFFKRLSKILGFKMVCFINDLEHMRMPVSEAYRKEEIQALQDADIILAPNQQSKEILQSEYEIRCQILSISVWDYLMPTDGSEICLDTINTETETMTTDISLLASKNVVAFAGNLAKSPFIGQLATLPLRFKLWGKGDEKLRKNMPANIELMGAYTPDEMPGRVSICDWGLVWDGSSIDTCDGQMGQYLRFNNSHKAGLYLAAGLPLIVWKESGMAGFVQEHKCGICVESLHEAIILIAEMNADTYTRFQTNARNVMPLVRSGHFFLKQISNIETKN